MAYTSYPDSTLWRSRSDGTDRMQLTYPPVHVYYPFISPDGKRVTYSNSMGEINVISMDGGSPQRIAEKNSWAASWSPDGNLLVFADYSDRPHTTFQFFDLRTAERSIVPGSQTLNGVQWVAENLLVASTQDRTKLLVFNVKTRKWSDLVPVRYPEVSSTGPMGRITSMSTTPPVDQIHRLCACGSPITQWNSSPA